MKKNTVKKKKMLQSQKIQAKSYNQQLQKGTAETADKILQPQEIGAKGRNAAIIVKTVGNMRCCKLGPQNRGSPHHYGESTNKS